MADKVKNETWTFETEGHMAVFPDKLVITGVVDAPIEIKVGETNTFRWGTQFKFNKETEIIEIFDPHANKIGEAPFDKVVQTAKTMVVIYGGMEDE